MNERGKSRAHRKLHGGIVSRDRRGAEDGHDSTAGDTVNGRASRTRRRSGRWGGARGSNADVIEETGLVCREGSIKLFGNRSGQRER